VITDVLVVVRIRFLFLVLEKLISGTGPPGMIEIQFINVVLGNEPSRIILKHGKGKLSL